MSKPTLRKGAKTYYSYKSAKVGTKKDAIQDKQIVKIQRQLNAMKPEMKYIDYYNTTSPTGGYVAFNGTLVAQGDNFNQRIGEEIKVTYFDLDLALYRTTVATSTICRFILLWDTQSNGNVVFNHLASLDLAEGLLDDTTIINTQLSPFNDRTKERYKILLDKRFLFNMEGSDKQIHFRKKINLHNANIKYSDSGATAASLTSRSLIMLYTNMGSSITHSTTGRLHYTDV
jgi:hypothetical protein